MGGLSDIVDPSCPLDGSVRPVTRRKKDGDSVVRRLPHEPPAHVSTVPFVWDDAGTRRDMTLASGVTSIDFDLDIFLAPRLGFAVAETPPS
jgi:hypothetical protein